MLASMPQMTVNLPADLDARLRRAAAEHGRTRSEITLEALWVHLRRSEGSRRRLLAAGAGRSGRGDISERIEEILRQETRR